MPSCAMQHKTGDRITTKQENGRCCGAAICIVQLIHDPVGELPCSNRQGRTTDHNFGRHFGRLGPEERSAIAKKNTTSSSSSYIGYSPLRSLHLLKMCMLIFELRFCSTFIIDCTFCRQQVDQVQKCVDQQRCYRARTWAWCARVGSVHTVTACIDPGKRSTVRPTHLAGR